MVGRALVLSGGGLAGIAWETGVLLGLRDGSGGAADPATDADVVVGTSAGSTVAAQLHGASLDDLYAAQRADAHAEIPVEFDLDALLATMSAAYDGGRRPLPEALRQLGEFALAAPTVPEATRRAVIEARLPDHEWPARRVLVTAVAVDGTFVAFDRQSGASLVDAVAASCAVPGIWPPVTIGGTRYVDGGMRSSTNADLAAECSHALALVTSPDALTRGPLGGVERELAGLAPARTHVVVADRDSLAAFGRNPLDPAVRRASAEAGYAQGRAAAAEVAAFWASPAPAGVAGAAEARS
jgi:NTE family protein